MAFDFGLTIALNGASRDQLYNWNREGLLQPEVSHDRTEGFLWSFRDVIALRTFVKLRTHHSLRDIRKALNSLRELNLTDHPSSYTLVNDGSSVFLVEDARAEATDLLVKKHQKIISDLDDVLRGFAHPSGAGNVVDFQRPRPGIQVDESRLAGYPTISNSRIAYDVIANLVYDGEVSYEDVPKYYPSVSPTQARDALSLLRQVENNQGWVV